MSGGFVETDRPSSSVCRSVECVNGRVSSSSGADEYVIRDGLATTTHNAPASDILHDSIVESADPSQPQIHDHTRNLATAASGTTDVGNECLRLRSSSQSAPSIAFQQASVQTGMNRGFVETDRPSSSVSRNLDLIRDGPAAIPDGPAATTTPNSGLIQTVLLAQGSTVLPEPVVTTAVTEEPAEVNSSPQPQSEPNPALQNVVVSLLPLDRTDGTRQEEVAAVPVEVVNAPKKRHDDATEQLESRILQEQEDPDGEVDALVCPICMEAWTNTGDHRICSLACGHLFGKSCIKRWLLQAGRKYSKCPHCNKRAKLEELRTLFVPRIAVVDGQGQQLAQEVQLLRAENHRLKLENAKLLMDVQQQNKERNAMAQAFKNKSFEYDCLKAQIGDINKGFRWNSGTYSRQPSNFRAEFNSRAHSSTGHEHITGTGPCSSPRTAASTDSAEDSFVLQNEVSVHGGKVFDMDADSQTLIFSNKVQGCGSRFGLSKMSFLSCTEIDKIDLPSDFGAVRDIRLSPSGFGGPGKLALVASAGKKLSVMSLESNNIVLTYSVQSPPWSCAWDPCVPNLFYSGLQTGSVLVLDLRQTSSPIALLGGPSIRPIHTLQVVPDQSSGNHHHSGSREILSASNTGIFRWNLGSSAAAASVTTTPQCVFSINHRVCVSLAYDGAIDTAVASFRRSPLAQIDSSSSHNSPSSQPNSMWPSLLGPLVSRPSRAAINQEEPCHWIFNRGQQNSSSGTKETSSSSSLSEVPQPHWRWVGAMVGHKSQSLFPRGAIISKWNSTPGSKSLFASGDDETNQVWVWDMESLRVTDTLVPHQSPVSDVKNVQIQGKDLMGCVSDTTFQLYQRLPLPH